MQQAREPSCAIATLPGPSSTLTTKTTARVRASIAETVFPGSLNEP
ncbi:hypothetical protein P2L57_31575 [Streptomyces ferralitis]|uniref:Uncharacterized protein n=1 Tax=Streptantibioticus ferralitis TaxID=236510 RepID=A0ABT5Z8E3_9ACTN|nr:hypothetical protein [Streptantibioticus ferralitis]